MKTFQRGLALSVLLLAACGPETGGLTARLVIDTGSRSSDGSAQRALRAAAIPEEIARLEITALTADGSTLATTVLAADPSPMLGEEQLVTAGGTWSLDDVEAGPDRVLRARAFLSTTLPASLAGKLAFAGQKTDIDVVADQTVSAGTVTLTAQPGVRIPRLDATPPGAPGPVVATPLVTGKALTVQWSRPSDDDVGGYLLAITSTIDAPAPQPTRADFDLAAGAPLGPDVFVVGWYMGPDAVGPVTVTDLVDGSSYKLLVYAYDTTLEGTPLNFSTFAEDSALVADLDPPGAFTDLALAVDAMDPETVVITFTAPAEDSTGSNAPLAYEVRTSTSRAALLDPDVFEELERLGAPPVASSGTTGMFERTFAALDQRSDRGFFLGIRAVDDGGNAGPIGVVEYSVTATAAPVITRLVPEIGLAGQPLSIQGRLLGPAAGTVVLATTTGTITTMTPLAASPWTTDRIQVNLPASARSGTLLVMRADGAMASAELAVLARIAPPPSAVLPPFSIVSAPLPGRTAAHAVYEAVDGGGTIEHGIRRIFGETQPLVRSAPFLDAAAPLAIGGSYTGLYDRFAFVAAADQVITAGLVSTATIPAVLRRTLAPIPGADGVGLALLTPTSTVTSGTPALLAFSVGGRIRTATIADVAGDAFGPFTIVTSSLTVASGVQLVHVATSSTSSVSFLGYRAGTGLTTRLGLMSQMGASPRGFVEDAQSLGPLMAERFAMVDVPGMGLLIAYEHRRADGTIEARLMMQRFFGLGPGLAPYPRGTRNRRLEDVGLVYRSGRVWIALATTTEEAGGSRQLHYAEIDPRTALADGYGTTEGVLLDIALAGNDMRAQLGGKPGPVEGGTPLIWNGAQGGGQTYIRR